MFLSDTPGGDGAPASFERPIDLVHLSRQTLGDRALEVEILNLFVVQARALVERLDAAAEPGARGDLAHTLKGSARAIGAFRVAAAAEACEAACAAGEAEWRRAFGRLARAVGEANGAIADLRHAA
jgi:HPt (histidine-containing phosphotransfer) domain-containing protein